MKFEIFLGNAQFQIPGIVHCPPSNFSIFPYFLQGTCSKRNCAVLHTTLRIQIGDESDFANNYNNKKIYGIWVIETQIISRRESLL